MIKPILACENPYQVAEVFRGAGWSIDFSQPPESGDPLVGISLFDNYFLLGVIEGYVPNNALPYIGCGIVFYLVIPKSEMENVYRKHRDFITGKLQTQSWGDITFEVEICGFKFMFASE